MPHIIHRQASDNLVFLIVLGIKQNALPDARRIFLAELVQGFVGLVARRLYLNGNDFVASREKEIFKKLLLFEKIVLSLQQQTYPASRKNSALRVSLFLSCYGKLF